MKYLLNDKVYDTEKADKIITYIEKIVCKGMFFDTYPEYEHTLYKTQKGNFFIHIGKYAGKDISYKDKDYIKLKTEDEIKSILTELNAVEIYEKLFGNLEEG